MRNIRSLALFNYMLTCEVHFLNCLPSLKIIEMYGGLVGGHLIHKTNILTIMIMNVISRLKLRNSKLLSALPP